MEQHKEAARTWFESLRDQLCTAFEKLEDYYAGPLAKQIAPGRFTRTDWKRNAEGPDAGGGTRAHMVGGRVFEKVGVNVSTVYGQFSEKFAQEIPGTDQDRSFWASGISVVAHPRSPHVPAGHMNTRMIVTGQPWFGGGADLTPMIEAARRADHPVAQSFHATLKTACDAHGADYYDRFKKWCDQYFYLPHRREARGVGGIFFDQLNSGDLEDDLAFTRDVGSAFATVYPKIVTRQMEAPWSEAERAEQLHRRGRYVEFNLLYDRGTRFGLETGGNVDAILVSLPPLAAWE